MNPAPRHTHTPRPKQFLIVLQCRLFPLQNPVCQGPVFACSLYRVFRRFLSKYFSNIFALTTSTIFLCPLPQQETLLSVGLLRISKAQLPAMSAVGLKKNLCIFYLFKFLLLIIAFRLKQQAHSLPQELSPITWCGTGTIAVLSTAPESLQIHRQVQRSIFHPRSYRQLYR